MRCPPFWKDGLRRELTLWSGASGCSAPDGEVAGLKRRCQYDEHSSSYAPSDALGYWPSKQIHSQRTIAFYAPGESPSPEGVISGVEAAEVDVPSTHFEARRLCIAQNARAPFSDPSLLQEASVNRDTCDPRTTHLAAPREPLQSPQRTHQPEDASRKSQRVGRAFEATTGLALRECGVNLLEGAAPAQDGRGAARSMVSKEAEEDDIPYSYWEAHRTPGSGNAAAALRDIAHCRDERLKSSGPVEDVPNVSQHAPVAIDRVPEVRAGKVSSTLIQSVPTNAAPSSRVAGTGGGGQHIPDEPHDVQSDAPSAELADCKENKSTGASYAPDARLSAQRAVRSEKRVARDVPRTPDQARDLFASYSMAAASGDTVPHQAVLTSPESSYSNSTHSAFGLASPASPEREPKPSSACSDSRQGAGTAGRASGARASASLSVLGLDAPKVVSGVENNRVAAERAAVKKDKERGNVPDAPVRKQVTAVLRDEPATPKCAQSAQESPGSPIKRAAFHNSGRKRTGAPGELQHASTAEYASQARPRRSPPSSLDSVPMDASSALWGASVVAGRVRKRTKVTRGFLAREKRRAAKQQEAAVAAPVAPQLQQKAPGDLLSNSRLRASKPDVESRETCQTGEIRSLTREHDEESESQGGEVGGESRWATAGSPCSRGSEAERARSPSASSDASEDESDDPLWGKEAVRRRESLNSRILPDLRAHRMSWLLETELQDCGCSSDFVDGLTCWYHLLSEVDGLSAATSLEKVVSEVEAKKEDILDFLGCDCYEAIQDQALSWKAQLEAGTLCEDPYLHSSESNIEEHYAQYNLCHETRKAIVRRHDNAVLVDEADECRKWTEEEVESWPILLWVGDGVPLREAPGAPKVMRVSVASVSSVLTADALSADASKPARSRYRTNVVLAEDAADRVRAALVTKKAPDVSEHPMRRFLEQEVPFSSPREPLLWSSLLEEMGVLGVVDRPEALLKKLEEDQDWVTDVVGLRSYEQMKEKVASLMQDVEQESKDGVLTDGAPVAKARKSVRFLEGDIMPSTRKNEADPLRSLT
ncbi:hypothetical protein BD626DRAFT_533169 [Schizophyllum amplum]|uniref:Uncharacterized protein n=1 Tax=Schizophyllum amplum TaxID=97359 RepID=A0A550CXN3_9AGAR|nr:hypothetical protein BD626DRAFT_533169 [Auriculariopsis ampla]